MIRNFVENWYSGNNVPRLVGGAFGPGRKPRPHQQRVIDHMKTHHRFLAVHGTGSGKTIMAVNIADDYLRGGTKDRIVIFVTPKAVQAQFMTEASLLLTGRPRVYFTTYEGLTNFMARLTRVKNTSVKSALKHAMIIADEAHKITKKTLNAKVFFHFFKSADKVFLMTGTPIQNGMINDLYPYARILNPSVKELENGRYILPQKTFQNFFKCKISFYNAPSNDPAYPFLHPPERRKTNLTQAQSNTLEGHKTWRRALSGVSSQAVNPMNMKSWSLNREIYAKFIFQNINTDPKFLEFDKIYTSRPHKTVVYFTQFTPLKRFKKFLEKRNIKYQEISGMTKNMAEINDPESKMVYLITDAAKEGIDFKGVRSIIFMDYPWKPSNYNQIVGRGRRSGSHLALPVTNRNVKVYHLTYDFPNPQTLNMRALEILNNKRRLTDRIITILKTVSIESLDCSSHVSPQRPRTTSPPNKYNPRTNRTILANRKLRRHVAVSPGGRKYSPTNLNKLITTPIKRTRTRPISFEPLGFASTRLNTIIPPPPPGSVKRRRSTPATAPGSVKRRRRASAPPVTAAASS